MSSYSVTRKDSGPRPTEAPALATETATRQEPSCNGPLVDDHVRAERGEARLVHIGRSPSLARGT